MTLLRDGDRESFVLALGVDCAAQWIAEPVVCQPGQREPLVAATSTDFGDSLGSSPTLATAVGALPMRDVQRTAELNTVNGGRVVVLPLSAAKRSSTGLTGSTWST